MDRLVLMTQTQDEQVYLLLGRASHLIHTVKSHLYIKSLTIFLGMYNAATKTLPTLHKLILTFYGTGVLPHVVSQSSFNPESTPCASA